MKIQERYASAIRSRNLRSEERTTYSDSDVIGAYGWASTQGSLAVDLERLFAGDNGAAGAVVETLAELARGKATAMRMKIGSAQAVDMARACLAWHRDGTCRPCGGHGKLVIPGTKTHGDRDCQVCRGTGKRPFEREFHPEKRQLARWLLAEMQRATAEAGPAAMRALAPRLEL